MTTKQQEHCAIWERYIRKECWDLRKARLAFIDKNWEAPRVPGRPIPREASKPDFSGFLPGGRHVVFEAKASLVETRFDFSLISEGQDEHLTAAHESGAVSWVYFLDGKRRKWVFPWGDILSMQSIRSSFPLIKAHDRYRKRKGETYLDTLIRLEVVE